MNSIRLLNTSVPIDEESPDPMGHELVTAHMVIDVKPDSTKKGRLVARGHLTDPLSSSSYYSVVSRESVLIEFVLTALNGLEVLLADTVNA
jgi:hypothetical protein